MQGRPQMQQQVRASMNPEQKKPTLKVRDLKRIAAYIEEKVGIQLPASKQNLVEGRLLKRLKKLGFADFKAYLNFALGSPEGDGERLHLIDAITTNKTDFFRESEHFTYLIDEALPQMEHNRIRDGRPQLNLWSAGCSTGEEPYTLSILLNEAVAAREGLKFNILATDISHSSLQTASRGIYTERKVSSVPVHLRQKYMLRSLDPDRELVQMSARIRNCISFGRFNLMDKPFPFKEKMDAIFCRNVMIYFNNQIRSELVARFERQLVPGGYLFVGHSESLHSIVSGLEQTIPMVYQKP